MSAQVTANNVGCIFLKHSVVMSVIMAEIDSLQKYIMTLNKQVWRVHRQIPLEPFSKESCI